ncbi:HEAT repeat domain-containing protein [Kitasatospora sp. NPDC059812]|uniref:HEAT repeat domain-containing protein n=1 Tax=Kitasatospora sp. NPDC059812 TaxID=3346958 RepID=UPI00366548C6
MTISQLHKQANHPEAPKSVTDLYTLLDDDDPAVRAATIYLLAWFPEESKHTLPKLLRLLNREAIPELVSTALIAVGLLGDMELVHRLKPFLDAEEQLVRWAAATALVRVEYAGAEPALGAQVLSELAATEAEPPQAGPLGIAFYDGDLRGYAATSLTLLGDRYPVEALDAVTEGLAGTSGPASFAITAAALRLAFRAPCQTSLPVFADLESRQQRLVRVLAALDQDTWRWANFLEILRAWGLPRDRTAMRIYASMPN